MWYLFLVVFLNAQQIESKVFYKSFETKEACETQLIEVKKDLDLDIVGDGLSYKLACEERSK